MIRKRSLLLLGSLMALTVIPASPAAATSYSNDEFDVQGTLGRFPCSGTACTTQFTGFANGVTYAHPTINGEAHDVVVNFNDAPVSGTASYNEPEGNLCGLVGTASSSSLTITGDANQAAGVIVKESDYVDRLTPTAGVVNGVTATLEFRYVRVGVASLVTLTGGSLTIDYVFPGEGQSSVTETLTPNGEAPAVFYAFPTDVQRDCASPGELDFRLIGDALAQTS